LKEQDTAITITLKSRTTTGNYQQEKAVIVE
jgi:hypothetical protein